MFGLFWKPHVRTNTEPAPAGWELASLLLCFPEHHFLHLLRPRGFNCWVSTMATSWIAVVFLPKHREVRPSRRVGSRFYRGLGRGAGNATCYVVREETSACSLRCQRLLSLLILEETREVGTEMRQKTC